jgi:hypothetical protein
MRISSLPEDPGFSQYAHMATVYLAGAERNNVVLADEERRYAVQLARDEFGKPVLDKHGKQRTQEFFGDVRIEAPQWLRLKAEGEEDDSSGLGAWMLHP